MEHSIGTTTRTDTRIDSHTARHAERQAERQARNDWLVAELNRLAATTQDPDEQTRYRRTADSLVRLATAMRP
ncbi:hypothetical protein [Kribbella sp. NPDC004536]|uniref:hypothetical protein n=1 Tax=Kribbella sp. NPDC004536 TaxID=3364106 RepID=UPI0036960872